MRVTEGLAPVAAAGNGADRKRWACCLPLGQLREAVGGFGLSVALAALGGLG